MEEGSRKRAMGSEEDPSNGAKRQSIRPEYGQQQGAEPLVVRILLPSQVVGALIGRGGATAKQIREESGVKMQIAEQQPDSNERLLSLTGSVDVLTTAFRLVTKRLAEEGERSGHGGTVTLRVVVPTGQAGALIGKGGATVKEMRDKTHTAIQVSPTTDLPERIVTVAGAGDAVAQAMSLIAQRLFENPARGGPPAPPPPRFDGRGPPGGRGYGVYPPYADGGYDGGYDGRPPPRGYGPGPAPGGYPAPPPPPPAAGPGMMMMRNGGGLPAGPALAARAPPPTSFPPHQQQPGYGGPPPPPPMPAPAYGAPLPPPHMSHAAPPPSYQQPLPPPPQQQQYYQQPAPQPQLAYQQQQLPPQQQQQAVQQPYYQQMQQPPAAAAAAPSSVYHQQQQLQSAAYGGQAVQPPQQQQQSGGLLQTPAAAMQQQQQQQQAQPQQLPLPAPANAGGLLQSPPSAGGHHYGAASAQPPQQAAWDGGSGAAYGAGYGQQQQAAVPYAAAAASAPSSSVTSVGQHQQQVTLANDLVGHLIGKGGSRINQIRQMSGAQIKIADLQPGSVVRLITLSGTPEQIQAAQLYINSSISDRST